MEVKILPRERTTPRFTLLVLALSLLAGLFAVGIVFLTKGVNPFFAIGKIFDASFGSWYGFTETITKAIPLILIGAGLAVAYQAKFWNIGAESQLLFGAIFATWVGLNWAPFLPRPVAIAAMLLAGFIGGSLWGVIPAFLKIRFGISEVITTLMMNYIANELVKFLVVGPWKGATKGGYPYTDDIADSTIFHLMGYSRISLMMMLLAVIVAFILCFLVYKSRFGYEIRVIGENTEAARYAGIDFFRSSLLIMVISGGVAGLAGAGEIGAIHHHLSYPETISGGLGFTAIIVAWLGRLNPAFSILSGMFFAGIIVGGDAIQISMGLPAATVNVFNGLILTFLIMGDFFLSHRLQFIRRSR